LSVYKKKLFKNPRKPNSPERNFSEHILCQKYIFNANIDLGEIHKSLAIFTSGLYVGKGSVADS